MYREIAKGPCWHQEFNQKTVEPPASANADVGNNVTINTQYNAHFFNQKNPIKTGVCIICGYICIIHGYVEKYHICGL